MAIAFRPCSVEGCNRNSNPKADGSLGFCNSHYLRFRRHGDPLAGQPMRGLAEQFLRETVLHHDMDECLIWPFARKDDGRGQIGIKKRTKTVPRVVCEALYGPPPTPKHEAAHSCGKGHEGCVAPRHLRWATRLENEADKLIHGTRLFGEKCGASKLSNDQVREIRLMRGTKRQKEIAQMYGVSQSLISLIYSRKLWPWLE